MITYGYKRNGSSIELDPDRSSIVKEVFRLCAESGYSIELIYRELYQLHGAQAGRSTVHSILNNKTYLGNERYPQIIDQELFNCARRTLQANKLKARVRPNTLKQIFSDGCYEGNLNSNAPEIYLPKNDGSGDLCIDPVSKEAILYFLNRFSLGCFSTPECREYCFKKFPGWNSIDLNKVMAIKFYAGLCTYQKLVLAHKYERIISYEFFNYVKKVIADKGHKRSAKKSKAYFKFFLTCPYGKVITASLFNGNLIPFYYCVLKNKCRCRMIAIREDKIFEKMELIAKHLSDRAQQVKEQMQPYYEQYGVYYQQLWELTLTIAIEFEKAIRDKDAKKIQACGLFIFKEAKLVDNRIEYVCTNPFRVLDQSIAVSLIMDAISMHDIVFDHTLHMAQNLVDFLLEGKELLQTNFNQDGVLAHISNPISFDDLLVATGLNISQLQSELFDYQLQGIIDQNGQGLWFRIKNG